MDLKERATNLEDNYSELRGHAYLLKLFLDDIMRQDLVVSDIQRTALDSISAYLLQSVDSLKYDINHLISYAMKN